MKKTNRVLGLVIIAALLFYGCTNDSNDSMMEQKTIEEDKEVMMEKDVMVKDEQAMEKTEDTMMESSYQGRVLAGTENTKYLEFNYEDYQKALKEKKKILLYFYANWCPLCRTEQVETFAAFNEINDPDLIGFRVDYKDSNTDDYEENLAKEFGVPYQHTKIILVNGERVLKAPDSWDKERYLEELAKI